MGGQDDRGAASPAAGAPGSTCRGAARRRRRRWARRGTACRARGASALAIITRRFMPPDSSLSDRACACPTATGRAASSRCRPHWARVPNRPRLKLTVPITRSNMSIVSSCGTRPIRRARPRGSAAADVVPSTSTSPALGVDDAADDADQRRSCRRRSGRAARKSRRGAMSRSTAFSAATPVAYCLALGRGWRGSYRSFDGRSPATASAFFSVDRARASAASGCWRRRR